MYKTKSSACAQSHGDKHEIIAQVDFLKSKQRRNTPRCVHLLCDSLPPPHCSIESPKQARHPSGKPEKNPSLEQRIR